MKRTMTDEEKVTFLKDPATISLQKKIKKEEQFDKTINISNKLHLKLKVAAVANKTTMVQLVDKFIKKGLTLLLLVLLVFSVGCASKMYTKVDKTNYERYQHSQKIEKGMSMAKVMKLFGSPSSVTKRYQGGWVIEFAYFRNIACSSVYCMVHFDLDDKEVVRYINFRQEYTNYVSLD